MAFSESVVCITGSALAGNRIETKFFQVGKELITLHRSTPDSRDLFAFTGFLINESVEMILSQFDLIYPKTGAWLKQPGLVSTGGHVLSIYGHLSWIDLSKKAFSDRFKPMQPFGRRFVRDNVN